MLKYRSISTYKCTGTGKYSTVQYSVVWHHLVQYKNMIRFAESIFIVGCGVSVIGDKDRVRIVLLFILFL